MTAARLHPDKDMIEARYRRIVESCSEGIWEMDGRYRTTFVNRAMAHMLGYVQEEMLGRLVTDFMFPEDIVSHEAQMSRRVRGKGGRYERRFRHKDGPEVWTLVSATALQDEAGGFAGSFAMFTDITRQKKTEAELKDLACFPEENPAPVMRVDALGAILFANKACRRLPGLPPLKEGERLPESLFDHVVSAFETLEPQEMEITDQESTVVFSIIPVVDRGYANLYGFDISERKRIEKALYAGEALLRDTGRIAKVGGWEVDARTLEVLWTEETYAIHEVPKGERPSLEEAIDFFHPDDRPILVAAIEKALADGTPYDLEVRFTTAKGANLWTRTICRPEMAEGKVVRLRGVFQDITGRKHAELELAERSRFLDETSAIARLGGWEHDLITRKATWTKQLYDIIELDEAEEPPGPDEHLDYYPPQERAILAEAIEKAVRDGESFDLELRCNTAKGRNFWARAKGYPIFEGGRCVRVRGIFQDISKQKETEERLEFAMQEAREANRAKSEFLANMSHEIRTPLNGVLGMLQLLELSHLDDEQARWVSLAMGSGNALLVLLNDLLDLSRIEAGVVRIEKEPFDLRVMLESLSEAHALGATSKGIGLSFDIDPDLPGVVEGDGPKLRQVLHNLIGNAIKFTEKGMVGIGVYLLPYAPAGAAHILFMIEDTGVGIPEDKLDYIFEPFAQVDGAFSRHFKGAGLGLRIVSRLVRHLGGGLSVVSEEGKGAVFAFSLPFAILSQREGSTDVMSSADVMIGGDTYRILVAEDDHTNQVAIRRLLEQAGHEVVCADDGRQALESFRNDDFDCIVMDISMPVMDGLEAMRSIRKESERTDRAKVPIIALTAHAMGSTVDAAMTAGADAYLAKPVEWARLVREIDKACHGGEQP